MERFKDILRTLLRLPKFVRYCRESNQFATMRREPSHKDRADVPVVKSMRLLDYGVMHPIPVSVYEVSLASQIIAAVKPPRVVDIGSNVHYLAVLSSFVPVTSIDVRDIKLQKDSFESITADGRELPFKTGSVDFLTTLCVMEHIGLGRYGDRIDPEGDRKFAAELLRVVKPRGSLVVSVPIGLEAICFNAHRIFSKKRFLEIFAGCRVVSEQYVGQHGLDALNPGPLGEYQTGVFHFEKN